MNASSSTPSAALATSSKTAAKRWSLAARLTAWFTASAFVLIVVTVCFLYWAVINTLEREDDRHLLDKADGIVAIMREHPDDRKLSELIERESGAVVVRVLTAEGQVVAESRDMHSRLPPTQFPAVGGSQEYYAPTGHAYHVLTMAGPAGRIVQVAMDTTAEEELLERFRWYAGLILAVALVACAAVGYTLARRGLRPLHDVTLAAQRVRSSTLHERIDANDLPAELAELTATFNDMLGRLEDSFLRLERFSADIAHELRTPVNNWRGEAEVALTQPRSAEHYAEVLASGLEECGRLGVLIDNLLFLARTESPQTHVVRQRLGLNRELATVMEFYQATAAEAGVDLILQAPPDATLEMDRTLFQRAIGNLIANALAHTPRGGTVRLSGGREPGGTVIEVSDDGRGIAAEHLPHVFDRFYRADPSRTGGSIGLGLSLVKSIAELHGGTCTIESEVGRGTRVRVTLPASY